MAAGTVTAFGDGDSAELTVLESVTATNGAPSTSTDGVSTNLIKSFVGHAPQTIGIKLWSTAGSGTMTVTVKLWGYANGKWVPVGTGADTTKGEINAVAAIGETSADSIVHSETMNYPLFFSRLYAEVAAIGGTATAISLSFLLARGY